VIEVNPRLASQFSDLYLRVHGLDPHAMSLALALGQDPAALPRQVPVAGAAASLVYRALTPGSTPPMPSAAQRAALAQRPDALLFQYPKRAMRWRATSSGWAATATASCTCTARDRS
jgi:hypothetical protein